MNIIRARRGDWFRHIATFTVPAGNDWVLDGDTVIWFTVKSKAAPGAADPGLLQLTTTAGDIEVTGNYEAVISAGSEAMTIDAGTHFYDIQVQQPGWLGPRTTEDGHFIVLPERTLTNITE